MDGYLNVVEENNMPCSSQKKSRIWELDFLRGFMIMLMVMDHLFMTTAYFFGREWFLLLNGEINGFTNFYKAALFYCQHPARMVIHPVIVLLFISLCGLSTGFSRNNLKRGCILGLVSLAVTTVSYALPVDGIFISFGILHNLTFCILLWSLISYLTKNNRFANLCIGIVISLTIFGLFFGAQINTDFKEKLGNAFFILVQTNTTFDFSPGDFFPIIPWSAIFFLSAALSPYLYPNKSSLLESLDGKWNKPICFIGRHTLFIYAVHLLLIIAVLELISYFKFGIWLFLE